MNKFKPNFKKHIGDYIKSRISKNMKLVNVTIEWHEGIDLDKFKSNNQEMTQSEQEIAATEQVVYIFCGENSNGDRATDVGYTSRRLVVRTKEHLQNGDYLEGFKSDPKVYGGEVSSPIGVERDLLEQVEGALIQFFKENPKGLSICNQSKLNTCGEVYKIEKICNNNIPAELGDILPAYMYLKND